MPQLSETRRARVLLVVSAIAAVVVAVGLGLAVAGTFSSDDEVDQADGRSSPPAPETPTDDGTASTTPATEPETEATEPRPTGQDPAIALEMVVELDQPSAIVDPAGEGPILVTTLEGRVHEVDLDSGRTEVVLDLTGDVSVGGERGLLGMAIDPDGERLYLNYTDSGGDTDIRSWPLADGRPQGGAGDGVLHLELGQPYANHNGGHLVFGPDGMLWIGTGDGGSAGDPGDVAQDPGVLLGKMLRVAPDPAGGVSAPGSNPDWGGRPEVWGIGLRNPWRYSFDRDTDRLWIADVGQNSTEEVSVVEPGADRPNFGWNEVEGGQPFDGQPDPAFVAPVVTYGHDDGCSITGGYVYRGEAIESLYGWYLFGDYCGGFIRAVPADSPEQEPVELAADVGQVISFGELEDGELLVLASGGISRVVVS